MCHKCTNPLLFPPLEASLLLARFKPYA
jgi:hypothetical protein